MRQPRANMNPADAIKELTYRIEESRRKLEEALAEIAEYASRLQAVTVDTQQRLLTRE